MVHGLPVTQWVGGRKGCEQAPSRGPIEPVQALAIMFKFVAACVPSTPRLEPTWNRYAAASILGPAEVAERHPDWNRKPSAAVTPRNDPVAMFSSEQSFRQGWLIFIRGLLAKAALRHAAGR